MKRSIPTPTLISVNNSYIAESIESKVQRIMNNNEPIKNEVQMIYTSSADGVLPETNIRTDKWELAVESMDKVTEQKLTKRKEKAEAKVVDFQKPEEKITSAGDNTDGK